MNFNILSQEDKLKYHQELKICVTAFSGMNHFLQLIENIRKTKPNPIMSGTCEVHFFLGTLRWSKVIFKDKIDMLINARIYENENRTLLPKKEHKDYKKTLNMIRTISPIEFILKPKDLKNGDKYSFFAFDEYDDRVCINPVFDSIFFSSLDTVKSALNYKV